jgi:uncharacterized protein YcaQ
MTPASLPFISEYGFQVVAKITLPSPTLTLSKAQARRFLLVHHGLWPPRQLRDKAGILDFFRRVGCIQFDPIDIVGRNPDLVLQARVADCGHDLLDELLYTDRLLWDGWDKVASIHLAADWPYFARHRVGVRRYYEKRGGPSMQALPGVLEAIRERGPLSSIDFKEMETIDWHWGRPASVAKAALDALCAMGELGIHHRVANRRVFDLVENLLPAELLSAPDPNEADEDYRSWHVLRRVGSLGLANPGAAQCWQGIPGVNGTVRRAVLTRLVERGDALAVALEDVPGRVLFARAADLSSVDAVQNQDPPQPQAAFVAPLDNLIWDRDLLRWAFDFDYTWEVYKPAAERKYAHYVLPVLYGDRFVARFEPAFDRKTREFVIANWWWEEGVRPDDAMQAALADCLGEFARYLEASQVRLGEKVSGEKSLEWAVRQGG